MSSTFFPFKGKEYESRRCICGMEECVEIRKDFQSIRDIRGHMQKLPNSKNNSRKGNLQTFNSHYLRRCGVHRNANLQGMDKQINHVAENRREKSEKTDVWVAIWHFNRIVLNAQAPRFETVSTVKNSMDLKEAKKFSDLFGSGKIYSNADVTKSKDVDVVAVVPTVFDLEKIRSEFQDAKSDKRVFDAKMNVSSNTTASKRKRTSTINTASSVEEIIVTSSSSEDSGENEKNAKALKTAGVNLLPEKEFFAMSKKKQNEHLKKVREDIEKVLEDLNKVTKQKRMLRKQLKNVQRSHKKFTEKSSEEINTLKRAIASMQDIANNTEDAKSIKKQMETVNESLLKELGTVEKEGGLNRLFMTSRDGIGKDPDIARQLLGFDDFEFVIDLIEAIFDVSYKPAKKIRVGRGGNHDNSLSDFEQIIMTLVWTNTLFSNVVIARMFGCRKDDVVTDALNKWMDVLGERGDMISSWLHLLNAEAIDQLRPKSYEELGLNEIAAVIDGKDFLCETVRVDRVVHCAQASNKMHASAIRVLTWSLPCGAVIERTPACLGRASEKAIMNAWGKNGNLQFPFRYMILGDKGFENTAGCYSNYNTTLHPSFLTHGNFNRDQIDHNITISQKRYSCEVVYSRVVEVRKLQGVFKREWFQHFEALLGWAHGRANFYTHLQKID